MAAHGNYLDIIALGTGPGTIYVDQVTLNSAPVAGVTVDDGPLQKGAVLRFIMRGRTHLCTVCLSSSQMLAWLRCRSGIIGACTTACSLIYTNDALHSSSVPLLSSGEENSHDIEQRVAEVHLTSTDQLEARLRSTSTSAVPHEDQAEQHQYLQMEHDLRASEEAIAELNKQIAALKGKDHGPSFVFLFFRVFVQVSSALRSGPPQPLR